MGVGVGVGVGVLVGVGGRVGVLVLAGVGVAAYGSWRPQLCKRIAMRSKTGKILFDTQVLYWMMQELSTLNNKGLFSEMRLEQPQ